MATILGTAMLLTAVSFTGCGRSVKGFWCEDGKPQKKQKEMRRSK